MAHGDGPAPATAFLPRLACAAMLLGLALPLFAQSRDPAVLTQDLLAKCQAVFMSCAKGCFGGMCKVCEDARDLCKADVHAVTGVPEPRSPYGWSLPPGMGIPIMIPPIPGISMSTTPRPYPSPEIPVVAPFPPTPLSQSKEYCDPENYPAVLQRYPGSRDAELLKERIQQERAELAKKIAEAQANADAASWYGKRAPRKELEALQKLDQALVGAAKVLDGVDPSSANRDTIVIGLNLTLDKILKDGLLPHSRSTKNAVGDNDSETAVLDSIGVSYLEKQNALGHLLSEYGAGAQLDRVEELVTKTGKECVIASCRGAGPMPPKGAKADEPPGQCNGKQYDVSAQCCTVDGIGNPVKKDGEAMAACPPDKRAPNPTYPGPKTNGCGSDGVNKWIGDRLDNPCALQWTGNELVPFFGYKNIIMDIKGCAMPSFVPACDFHDKCWGTCNTSKTGTSQEICDAEFGDRIAQICDSVKLSDKNLKKCQFWAKKYQWAVGTAGDHYNDTQAEACVCCEGAK